MAYAQNPSALRKENLLRLLTSVRSSVHVTRIDEHATMCKGAELAKQRVHDMAAQKKKAAPELNFPQPLGRSTLLR